MPYKAKVYKSGHLDSDPQSSISNYLVGLSSITHAIDIIASPEQLHLEGNLPIRV